MIAGDVNTCSGSSNPVDQPAVIIIFGAAVRPDGSPSETLRGRVAAALRWAAHLEAPVFVPTGGVGRHGPSEAAVMARLLREAAVPASRILIEPTAHDTLGSARACASLLRGHAGPVFAASNGYHLARCLMLLRLAGIRATGCPPPPASGRFGERWLARLRELAALPVDLALGLVQLRLARRVTTGQRRAKRRGLPGDAS